MLRYSIICLDSKVKTTGKNKKHDIDILKATPIIPKPISEYLHWYYYPYKSVFMLFLNMPFAFIKSSG